MFSLFSDSVWGEAFSSSDPLSDASDRVSALAAAVADSPPLPDASGTGVLVPLPTSDVPAMELRISESVSATVTVPPAASASS